MRSTGHRRGRRQVERLRDRQHMRDQPRLIRLIHRHRIRGHAVAQTGVARPVRVRWRIPPARGGPRGLRLVVGQPFRARRVPGSERSLSLGQLAVRVAHATSPAGESSRSAVARLSAARVTSDSSPTRGRSSIARRSARCEPHRCRLSALAASVASGSLIGTIVAERSRPLKRQNRWSRQVPPLWLREKNLWLGASRAPRLTWGYLLSRCLPWSAA